MPKCAAKQPANCAEAAKGWVEAKGWTCTKPDPGVESELRTRLCPQLHVINTACVPERTCVYRVEGRKLFYAIMRKDISIKRKKLEEKSRDWI